MRLSRLARIRVALLLGCLLVVAATSAHQRVHTRSWGDTLAVSVYPLDGDGHPATADYVAGLSAADFAVIDDWGAREARRHGLALERPFRTALGAPIETLPPAFPTEPNALTTLWWGLRFRFWAWRHTPDAGPLTRVRVFVVYHQGEEGRPLAHSLGLQQGLLGLVHAYARPAQTAQNAIVVAHELLHTVGASDKYGPSGEPLRPVGYADPDRRPLHPQRDAEIMAGRVALSPERARMAGSLRNVRVNAWTAAEINWLD